MSYLKNNSGWLLLKSLNILNKNAKVHQKLPRLLSDYQDLCRTKCPLFNRCSSNIINVILVLIKIDLFIQNSYVFFRSSRPDVFCKKGVLRNFARFTGKHLWHRCFWFLSNMTFWWLWWQAVIRKNDFF